MKIENIVKVASVVANVAAGTYLANRLCDELNARRLERNRKTNNILWEHALNRTSEIMKQKMANERATGWYYTNFDRDWDETFEAQLELYGAK